MKYIVSAFVLILLFSSCSVFVSAPEQIAKGDDTICILYNETRFKVELVNNITAHNVNKGCRIVTDVVKRAKFYNSADYAALVYMAEYWSWHTPWHAKRFFERNKYSRNTLFVVTSGDPDVEIHKPFDAVTSASSPKLVGPVARAINEKLDRILK